jgi:hypothetical protein
LKDLKHFISQEAIKLDAEDEHYILGDLNRYRYGLPARPPSVRDWEKLEKSWLHLIKYLDYDRRKRFSLRATPKGGSLASIVVAISFFLLPHICYHNR